MRNTRGIFFPNYSGCGRCQEITSFLINSKWDITVHGIGEEKYLTLDSVFEVPTEEEHWAMSEEVSISLHTEKDISYTGMNGLKRSYVQISILSST